MIRKLLAKLVGSTPKKPASKTARKPKKRAASKKAVRTKAAARPKTKPARKSPAKKKPGPSRKTSKKSPRKPSLPVPAGDQVGEVVAFFRIPVVAVIKVTRGTLKAGELIWIKGHTTDFKLNISSMQIDHRPVSEAKKGQEVGLKVPSRTRRGDRVYRIS